VHTGDDMDKNIIEKLGYATERERKLFISVFLEWEQSKYVEFTRYCHVNTFTQLYITNTWGWTASVV
jgi:hypothetical protein